jgi:hypothetical protein
MTIVTYTHRPKWARKAKAVVDFPIDRIVSARPPKKRHAGDFEGAAPDEAQRTELIKQFMERTLKG